MFVGAVTTKRRLREERGQGLVEYALILALVSLAAIVALGFLSGKINSLFSKTGNSLNTVNVSDGGGGTSTGTSTGGGSPPTAGTVSISCPGARCDVSDTLTANLTGWSGATSTSYAWQQHETSGSTCSTGSGWVAVGGNTASISAPPLIAGAQDAIRVTVIGTNANGSTAPVCASVVLFATDAATSPPAGSVTITCPGGSCSDGEIATASTGTWTGSPAPVLTYAWSINEDSGDDCGDGGWGSTVGTGSTFTLPSSGFLDSDSVRVIVTGTNSDPGSPVTACDSAAFG
jgi:pilus assembly protein Flp/PilA